MSESSNIKLTKIKDKVKNVLIQLLVGLKNNKIIDIEVPNNEDVKIQNEDVFEIEYNEKDSNEDICLSETKKRKLYHFSCAKESKAFTAIVSIAALICELEDGNLLYYIILLY